MMFELLGLSRRVDKLEFQTKQDRKDQEELHAELIDLMKTVRDHMDNEDEKWGNIKLFGGMGVILIGTSHPVTIAAFEWIKGFSGG